MSAANGACVYFEDEPAGSAMSFPLTFSITVGTGSRNRMQKKRICGVGALIRRNEDIHFAEPLIRSGAQERGLLEGIVVSSGAACSSGKVQPPT